MTRSAGPPSADHPLIPEPADASVSDEVAAAAEVGPASAGASVTGAASAEVATAGAAGPAGPSADPVVTIEVGLPVSDRLSVAIRSRLGRSLHIRQLDAGSCNGCDWEIAALLNPYHDLQRLGMDIVASPRHADLLLVTGIMTRNLEQAARLTYEAMPEPRLVVAVGACAISGGVFAGTYAGRSGIAEVLPVDVRVPGCPPRPEALLEGLLVAVGRLPGRD